MANQSAVLDGVFVALSDSTRRAVVRRLGEGPRSVSELAREFPISLPSFMKHVHMLETHGIIRTAKSGRVRTCHLERDRLREVDDWLAEQRRVWVGRTDRLEAFVTEPSHRTASGDQTDSPTDTDTRTDTDTDTTEEPA